MVSRKLKVGIVRFPGSNCDFDTLNYFHTHGHEAFFIWYKETSLPPLDLIVLPGGFAFGDRAYERATASYTIDPGRLALSSPVMQAIRAAAKRQVPILGICNGFQILVKSGLLPGRLEQNDSKKFFCDYVACKVEGPSFFGDTSLLHKRMVIPVAHGYGKFTASKREIATLEKRGQIFLRYESFNPNGSVGNIAGVCNDSKNIFGLMPHPERSPEASRFIHALEHYVAK